LTLRDKTDGSMFNSTLSMWQVTVKSWYIKV